MASEYDWASGEGLSRIDDPAAVDAAFERGEQHLGTAVVGLAFTCPLAEASPRIVRAMRLPDPVQRQIAFTAAGTAARVNGALTPELYDALRAEGSSGFAETAIDDTLTFVPFRELPPWLKRRWLLTGIRDTVQGWWLRTADAVDTAWRSARRRRP
jgi:hypothetical protein